MWGIKMNDISYKVKRFSTTFDLEQWLNNLEEEMLNVCKQPPYPPQASYYFKVEQLSHTENDIIVLIKIHDYRSIYSSNQNSE